MDISNKYTEEITVLKRRVSAEKSVKESYIERCEALEKQNSELREALEEIRHDSLSVTYNFEHSDQKMREMGRIAEQALNSKEVGNVGE